MKEPSRSWSSVCAECALYRTERCPSLDRDLSPDDCIAAVCAGFAPGTPEGKALKNAPGTGPGGDAEEWTKPTSPAGKQHTGRSGDRESTNREENIP